MSTSRRRDFPNNQKQLRDDTADRLEAIVKAAERAAENVIDDAETQARRYLEQARAEADRLAGSRFDELSALIDTLLSQAASLRQEAELLQATLEEARARVGGEAVEDPAEVQVPRLQAVSEEKSEPVQPADPDRADASAVRLLATQLAVSGSSREEIESRLRIGFDIDDPSAILDAILGPED
jgi:vacuolar-type H+-ATPase subunit H